MRKTWTCSFPRHWAIGASMCLMLLSGVPAAFGDHPLVVYKSIPLALAQRAAAAAVAQCQQDGYRVSAAVVDIGGALKALLRADGAGPHTQDSSFKKAYTAASLRRSTNELAALIAKMPEIQALRDMNERILVLGGGLPIVMEGAVVGGIGVGGAPGAHLDEACARAGLERIGAAPATVRPAHE